jgi:ankyrin repeat protein
VVEVLLKAGADVNYRDLGGRTELDAAIEAGKPEVEKLLRAARGKERQKAREAEGKK